MPKFKVLSQWRLYALPGISDLWALPIFRLLLDPPEAQQCRGWKLFSFLQSRYPWEFTDGTFYWTELRRLSPILPQIHVHTYTHTHSHIVTPHFFQHSWNLYPNISEGLTNSAVKHAFRAVLEYIKYLRDTCKKIKIK